MAADKIIEEYIRTHPGSQKLHERAEKIFATNGATYRWPGYCSRFHAASR